MATEGNKRTSERKKRVLPPRGSGGDGGGGPRPSRGEGYDEELGDNIRLGGEAQSLFLKAGAVGVLGLLASAGLGMLENDGYHRFSLSYLTAFCWTLAIGVGGVFWVTLQHLVNAHWSVTLRRLGELFASSAPLLAVLALPIVVPIFFGNGIVYEWADAEKVHASHLLHHKAPYLNPTFFLIRFVVYFGFWTLLARYFLRSSVAQETGGDAPALAGKMRAVSGPAMIVFALTVTFCAIDLLMSLDPLWFSTIFGVYFLASCVLGINSSLALFAMWLQGKGRLAKSVTVDHYHDLGKMMFGFTVFWAYIGFSQFMLIWYANIPEETAWYKERFAGGWGTLSIVLLLGHFVIPFFGLLSRHIKRNKPLLGFWAIWILLMIYLDMYWLVMPNTHQEHVPFALIDVTCLIGMIGIFVAGLALRARNVNLLPTREPRLAKSLAFENI